MGTPTSWLIVGVVALICAALVMTVWHTINRCKHPADLVWLGPPDGDGFHVAACRGCWKRWVAHDSTVSDGYIERMREYGHTELADRLERSNETYRAQRSRANPARR